MPKLCVKKDCTGCYACSSICPKAAIAMKENECGYIYPVIDEKKCVECKMCEKTCPHINRVGQEYPLNCYAARVKDKDMLKKASSGGIATLISRKIIEKNGVVYGAAFGKDCCVEHIRIEKEEELEKLRGSKYVHSYIKDSYINAKKDLENKKIVLFIGTPCQIAGLKRYLKKEYEDLYTVDLICHGVPSQKFLKDEVKRLNNNSIEIDRVNFRDKDVGDFKFAIKKKDDIVYSKYWYNEPYYYTFMRSITYRENCYNCLYAKPERVSDLTIGDFWGLGEDSKFYATRNDGISVILPITLKGKSIIEMISENVEMEERKIQEAIQGNAQLREHVKKNKYVDKFKETYKDNNNFYLTYRKICAKHIYKEKLKSNALVKMLLKVRNEVKNAKE